MSRTSKLCVNSRELRPKCYHVFEQASAQANDSGAVHRVQQQCTVVIVVSAAGGFVIANLRRVMGFDVMAARQRTPKENEQLEHST